MKKIILLALVLFSVSYCFSQRGTNYEQYKYLTTLDIKPNLRHFLKNNLMLYEQQQVIFLGYQCYIMQIIDRGEDYKKWDIIGYYAYLQRDDKHKVIIIPKIIRGDISYTNYLQKWHELSEDNKMLLNMLLSKSILDYTEESNQTSTLK